ncbi:hypothetical protein LCGC14_1747590 [marine sediment metagenome]|uniref:Uncharacterized protein n=1 Tax=marine sediment metagenome TaxID=412755 RepID=A0A0F9H4T6_9ZZZZ
MSTGRGERITIEVDGITAHVQLTDEGDPDDPELMEFLRAMVRAVTDLERVCGCEMPQVPNHLDRCVVCGGAPPAQHPTGDTPL